MYAFRVSARTGKDEMKAKIGKLLQPGDVNVMLTGPTRVLKLSGEPLAVYLPGAIPTEARTAAYPVLHSLKSIQTDNRGAASATPGRYQEGKRNYGMVQVASAIVGVFEGNTDGDRSFCRLTAWTGKNWPNYEQTWPLLQVIAERFAEHVPERYAAQMAYVRQSQPDWIIPHTPFTTITVNNSYPTGVHKDKGDLESGFSCLAVLRRGGIKGGALCFPEWRVGVELQDGDLLLMDAHDWHGNLPLDSSQPSTAPDLYGAEPEPERISVVCYFRTNVAKCGNAEAEQAKHQDWADKRFARADQTMAGKA